MEQRNSSSNYGTTQQMVDTSDQAAQITELILGALKFSIPLSDNYFLSFIVCCVQEKLKKKTFIIDKFPEIIIKIEDCAHKG